MVGQIKSHKAIKIVGLIIGAVAFYMLGASIQYSGDKEYMIDQVSSPDTPQESQAPKEESKPKPAPQPIKLSGTSKTATKKFNLQEGLATFKMSYQGDSNFIVELLDTDGNDIDNLANEIGNFNGSIAEQIDIEGDYLLNVEAEGPWTITITQ